jgi:hypothetical protein
MSEYVRKEGTATLFRNTFKDKPNQPDYRGELRLLGQSFKLSAWIKDGRNGKFLNIAVTEAAAASEKKADDFEDDFALSTRP